jgi:hypothetical protein
MGKYKGEEKNNRLVVSKSIEKLADENNKLSKDLDYITKEELIEAVHVLAAEISKLKGEPFDIKFTYENKKNKL